MPIRIASVTKRIAANGQALHRAVASRMEQGGSQPSEEEASLLAERRTLKEERDKRKAHALDPKPTALERLKRTHHALPKDKPKASKDAQAGEVKKPKARRTRAEKHAEKEAAIAAARAPKKAATK